CRWSAEEIEKTKTKGHDDHIKLKAIATTRASGSGSSSRSRGRRLLLRKALLSRERSCSGKADGLRSRGAEGLMSQIHRWREIFNRIGCYHRRSRRRNLIQFQFQSGATHPQVRRSRERFIFDLHSVDQGEIGTAQI